MAYEIPGDMYTYPANTDLSASQFCFVNLNTSGKLVLPASGGPAIGVLQNKPNAAGVGGNVMVDGVTKLVAGGTVAAGALITTDTAGNAITATTGLQILGRSQETASASVGQIISVLLVRGAAVV